MGLEDPAFPLFPHQINCDLKQQLENDLSKMILRMILRRPFSPCTRMIQGTTRCRDEGGFGKTCCAMVTHIWLAKKSQSKNRWECESSPDEQRTQAQGTFIPHCLRRSRVASLPFIASQRMKENLGTASLNQTTSPRKQEERVLVYFYLT